MLANSFERRKGELLNLVAKERLSALDSADGVCRSAKAGMVTVQGSGRLLRYAGLAVAGLAVAAVCASVTKGLFFHRKVVDNHSVKSGFFRTLLLQGATIVLFPYLRSVLTGDRTMPTGAVPRFDLSRYKPGRIFFRWLGLEK